MSPVVEVDPEAVQSPALRRLLEEVLNEDINSTYA